MTRQDSNRKILEILSKIVEVQPDWRFGQILENAGTVLNGCDMFFEESTETLKRMQKRMMLRKSLYDLLTCTSKEDIMHIEDEWYAEMLKHQHDADVSIEGLRTEETDAEEQLRKEASGEI